MAQITCLSNKASMIILISPLVTITYDKHHQKQNNKLECSGGQFSPDDPFLSTDRGEVQDGVYFIKVKWLKDHEDFDHVFDDECDDDGGYDDGVGNSWEVQGDVCFIKVRQLQLWLS